MQPQVDIELDRVPDEERPLVLAVLLACYQRKGPNVAPTPTPGAPGTLHVVRERIA